MSRAGLARVTELCAAYGISRKTAYKRLARYEAGGCSRLLRSCRALTSTQVAESRPGFVRAFQAYGLPVRIRSDNGVPFATQALARLSPLSVWWVRLGIRPDLTEPASPQQNGRHERLHRTLKAECTRPPRPPRAAGAL